MARLGRVTVTMDPTTVGALARLTRSLNNAGRHLYKLTEGGPGTADCNALAGQVCEAMACDEVQGKLVAHVLMALVRRLRQWGYAITEERLLCAVASAVLVPPEGCEREEPSLLDRTAAIRVKLAQALDIQKQILEEVKELRALVDTEVVKEAAEEAVEEKGEEMATWAEYDGQHTAPKVDANKFGSHHYPGDEGTSDCSHNCGCWMGPARSGGPVDPLGPCPANPKGSCEGEDGAVDEAVEEKGE